MLGVAYQDVAGQLLTVLLGLLQLEDGIDAEVAAQIDRQAERQ